MGWKTIDEDTCIKISKHKRVIAVYPHTSKLDFMYYMLYVMSLDVLHTRVRTVINADFMSTPILGQIASFFGAIAVEERGGTLDVIYQELSSMDSFYFLVSPKGSIQPNPWRTGYYRLAKKLNCELVVVGLDYDKRELVVGTPFAVGDMTFQQVTRRLQREMSHIHALNVEYLEYDSPHRNSLKTPSGFGNLTSLMYNSIIAVLSVVTLVILYLVVNQ